VLSPLGGNLLLTRRVTVAGFDLSDESSTVTGGCLRARGVGSGSADPTRLSHYPLFQAE
jgi:hypothetical protein